MDFFDKLGKKASEAYKITTDKTGKIARETKIKIKIGDLKSQINDIYEEIGKKVYEKHIREEEISIKKELEDECVRIDILCEEINSLQKEQLELKDKRKCSKCYTEIEKEYVFCPNCGEKQEIELDIVEKEIEVEENDIENQKKEIKNENPENIDKKKENIISDLEKTIQVESAVEVEEEELVEEDDDKIDHI